MVVDPRHRVPIEKEKKDENPQWAKNDVRAVVIFAALVDPHTRKQERTKKNHQAQW
jgi:hypothetical protein